MSAAENLASKRCKPCEGGVPPMTDDQVKEMLKFAPGWQHSGGAIERTFFFKNYYETVAFVNAVAWIAHQEDHHPAIEFGYKSCRIRYNTHAIKGISENDFICAAKVNALVSPPG